jgi:hypothetical protein
MMLYGQNETGKSEKSPALPPNANVGGARASTAEITGAVHRLPGCAGVTVVELRAGVVEGKVALWLRDGQSELGLGELDTVEITGPSSAEAVELRIADITVGGQVAYKVSGVNEAGCMVGAWPRNDAGTGIRCVLPMPCNCTQTNWIKFTIAAAPLLGQPTPLALDPVGVVKKEGAG